MPKRSGKRESSGRKARSEPKEPPSDPAPGKLRLVARVEAKKNPAAVALGRLGGKKGGAARAAKLSAKRRSEIARKAAKARWEKK